MRTWTVAALLLAGVAPAMAAPNAVDAKANPAAEPAKKPMRELPSPYTPNYVGGARPPADRVRRCTLTTHATKSASLPGRRRAAIFPCPEPAGKSRPRRTAAATVLVATRWRR